MNDDTQFCLAKVLVARTMYSKGLPYMSDAEYDMLTSKLALEGMELSPIYEDDPVPYDAFKQVLGIEPGDVDILLNNQQKTSAFSSTSALADYAELVNDSASLSIHAVTEYEDAFNWFRAHIGEEILISTKVDGINTRRGWLYENEACTYKVALTRGRSSEPWNVTNNMSFISPPLLVNPKLKSNLLIYSETVVPFDALTAINDKYGESYTIPRGLAMSMMRAQRFEPMDYQWLKSFVFRVDYGDTLEEGLHLAEELGFPTVPYITYTYNGEPFDVFHKQIDLIMRALKDELDNIGIITDGMVAEVNDRHSFLAGDVKNNYSTQNIALKMGLWHPGVYEGLVESLDISQSGDRFGCVAVIKPVRVKGGQSVRRVNCYNPATVITRNILPGTKIRFEYKNETTVNLIQETIL